MTPGDSNNDDSSDRDPNPDEPLFLSRDSQSEPPEPPRPDKPQLDGAFTPRILSITLTERGPNGVLTDRVLVRGTDFFLDEDRPAEYSFSSEDTTVVTSSSFTYTSLSAEPDPNSTSDADTLPSAKACRPIVSVTIKAIGPDGAVIETVYERTKPEPGSKRS